MANRNWTVVALIGGLSLATSHVASAQQQPQAPELTPRQKQLQNSIQWQQGPCEGKLGTVATIKVPAGYSFTGGVGARAYMEFMGNPPDPSTLGVIKPAASEEWLIEFNYDNMGYVKDDEKDKIDANAILDSLKKGTEEGNKKRAQMGSAALHLIGWEKPPFYDTRTNRLTWAIRAQSEGEFVINYNTKLLGRGGVMSANLICDPVDLEKTLPTFDTLLGDFSFVVGQKYSEFREGDRVAEYGLAALVAGGAFAVAAKTGFLAKFLKPIIIGLVLLGGVIAKFWRSIFGRRQ